MGRQRSAGLSRTRNPIQLFVRGDRSFVTASFTVPGATLARLESSALFFSCFLGEIVFEQRRQCCERLFGLISACLSPQYFVLNGG